MAKLKIFEKSTPDTSSMSEKVIVKVWSPADTSIGLGENVGMPTTVGAWVSGTEVTGSVVATPAIVVRVEFGILVLFPALSPIKTLEMFHVPLSAYWGMVALPVNVPFVADPLLRDRNAYCVWPTFGLVNVTVTNLTPDRSSVAV